MKPVIATLVICLIISIGCQAQHKLEKLWETDTVVAVPESVLVDLENNTLYVAQIDGAPWEADGKGAIGKLSLDGKTFNGNWITGLHAPKGMGKYGKRLYVADITDVVVIDIAGSRIEKRIPLAGAATLNDLTVDDNGIVYVSDSRNGNIYRLENDNASVYLTNKPNVNGLKAVGKDLYIFNNRQFEKAGPDKSITPIVSLDAGGDGIEPVGNGDFLLSVWNGIIYYAYADGRIELILDTRNEKKNAADIGYDVSRKIVYVPTFFGKTIAAYRLL